MLYLFVLLSSHTTSSNKDMDILLDILLYAKSTQ